MISNPFIKFLFFINFTLIFSVTTLAETKAPTSTDEKSPTPTTSSTTSPSNNSSSTLEPATLANATTGMAEKANVVSNTTASTFPKEIQSICNSLMSIPASSFKQLCVQSFAALGETCNSKYSGAAGICNPDTNGDLTAKSMMIQGMLGAAQASINDSCSTFSKAMDLGKMAMAAYTTYCAAKQKMCDSACSEAVSKIEILNNNVTNINNALTNCISTMPVENPERTKCVADELTMKQIQPLLENELKLSPPTLAAKAKVCKIDMTSLLGMGVANIGALAQSKAMADQCEKEASSKDIAKIDCTKAENKEKPECKNVASAIVDCAVATNADKPICICKANPRLKGCESVSTALATNSALANGGTGSASGRGLKANLGGATDAAANKQFPAALGSANKNDGSGFSTNGFGGGSNAGLTGSSDGTHGEGDLEKKSAAGNADILSTESGGGGGYRLNFGNSASPRSLLRNVATSDRVKGKLSGMAWASQVTSNAGKSNFEKIRVRYIENRTSLLNR